MCPTEEYRKVESMDVSADQDRIAIRLEKKHGERLDSAEIDACLQHTVGKWAARLNPARVKAR